MPIYCHVLLPLPLTGNLTYVVPHDWENHLQIGHRVIVPLGTKKIVTGIVCKLNVIPTSGIEPKSIIEICDPYPIFNSIQLDFIFWMANYYMCQPGEVLNAALPSGFKLTAESKISLHPEWGNFSVELTHSELLIVEHLKTNDVLTVSKASKILKVKNIFQWLNKLARKKAIIIYQEVKERYQPKIQKRIRLHQAYITDKNSLSECIESLAKKPTQQELLLAYLQEVPVYQHPEINAKGIPKNLLLDKGAFESPLKTLIKKGIFEEFTIIVSRLDELAVVESIPHSLSTAQQQAYRQILEGFITKPSVLLHGVTGSGKTEIYIELIKQILAQEEQVLFMLPEIAITTQILARLKKVFGQQLGVYHSKYSDNERVEVWQKLINNEYKVIIGVRSSVFLPFRNLGLIIVDEEHEPSYKQTDAAPRYHARDAALYLARIHHAKVVLGSATPSVESFYMAQIQKWSYIALTQRFSEAALPAVEIVDLKKDKSEDKSLKSFSIKALDATRHNLAAQKQTILFQNRRGYAPFVACEVCGFVPQCKSCNVSLTYHLFKKQLNCHYCGYYEKMPTICPSCGGHQLKTQGLGTEQLEEEAQLLFDNAKIIRMDLDTTRTKTGIQKLIHAVEQRQADIIVGTQMVAKGLDFEHVETVVVFDIDRMLHYPNFRSTERVFQLLAQVAGRAGRKSGQGKVFIQTYQPYQPVFQWVAANDYAAFYQKEIVEREKHGYPPFSRLIKITVKDMDKKKCEQTAFFLAQEIRNKIGSSLVLGPQAPPIDKIKDYYLQDLYIKIPKQKVNLEKCKELVGQVVLYTRAMHEFKSTLIIVDVDCL